MATENPSLVTVDESACQRFEVAWQEGRPEPIEQFLPPEEHVGYLATLEELIHIELEFAWKSWWGQTAAKTTATVGRPVCVEAYLARFPRLAEAPVVMRLLQQEYRVRHRYGDRPSTAEYSERFPSLVLTGREVQGNLQEEAVGTAELPNLPGYQILGFLGRGGMGTVFKARQTNLNRLVALKMILAGSAASAKELARFHTEAEAVARLQHPHIVQIHDVGQHQGCPYLALEFVEGGTLAQKLAGAPQPARQAAQLVETLARAMHVAHQRGIVHRDLKPANVLLSSLVISPSSLAKNQAHNSSAQGLMTNDQGLVTIPKITDFGLAKLLDSESGQTTTGVTMGTPSYMAPEQATGRTQEIGPATDTYALGAILYEMLTGRPPFRGETPLSTMEQVRSQEPVPPSQLHPKVPRDLETICLKCLEKQPRKRYASTEELADDLARFVAGEPIRARPTPAWERGLKWAKRRPTVAVLLGVSSVAAFTVVVVILMANARLQRERDYADDKRRDAETQRQQALANFRIARAAVDELSKAGHEQLALVPQMEPVRKDLLRTAVKYYLGFMQQASDDPELRYEAGRNFQRLSSLYDNLGEWDNAAAAARQALAINQQLVADLPDEPMYRRELARCQRGVGQLLIRKSPSEGEAFLWQALKLQEQLLADYPADAHYQAELAYTHETLGVLLHSTGRRAQAEEAFRKVIGLLEEAMAQSPASADYEARLSVGRSNLGALLGRDRRFVEAEPFLRQDRDYWAKKMEQDPALPNNRSKLARSQFNLGLVLRDLGRGDEAEPLMRAAINLRKGLAEDFPKSPYYHADLGRMLRLLARLVLANRNDQAEARRLLEQAVARAQTALRLAPGTEDYLEILRDQYSDLTETLVQVKDHAEAARIAQQLAHVFPQKWEGYLSAGSFLGRCAALAEKDDKLSDDRRNELAKEYADQAVQRLRDAVQKGYLDLHYLKTDEHLNVLRGRDDFQKLLSELAEKSRKGAP
jgi:serine/threonine protein kinase